MRTYVWTRTSALCLLVLSALAPLAARALEGEPARIRAAGSLLDEVVQGLLPSMVRLPPPSGEPSAENRPTLATLTELKYCGVTDKGAGRFRAVLHLDTVSGPIVPSLGKSGCQGGLADIVKRLGEEGPGIAVADVEATWRPWELRLAVARAEATTKIAKTRVASVLEKRRELMLVPTGDTRIQTDAGPIALYAVPSFLAGAVEIAVVIGGSGAPSSPERLASPSRGLAIADDGNAAAEVPQSFANQLLRRLTWSKPLLIPLDRDEVELQNVSIGGEGAGEGARVTLTGNATPTSIRETMRWTMASQGDPLRVSSAKIAAQMEDCSGLGTMAAVACNVRNGARNAAAEAFAASLTQRFQGVPVHQLASPQTLRFSVADQRVILTGDLLRMTFSSRGLAVNAKLAPP
jgi:hypothetical protein